jgi:tRNA/tmRNA/rRNA uracil-C5-methylase (TrmA/RlmC/RlmD family)
MTKTFSEYYDEERRRSPGHAPRVPVGSCVTPDGRRCRLCHAPEMEYEREVHVKAAAFRRFWSSFASDTRLAEMLSSPLGRGYRVVTKRKVHVTREGFSMGLIDPLGRRLLDVGSCAIEPELHAAIYARIAALLRHRSANPLVTVLQYVILKGNYEKTALIFNVAEISQHAVKAANTVSKLLTREFPAVQGVFLVEDDRGDRYYMGGNPASGAASFRRLYGDREISLPLDTLRLVYDVQAFSQVNLSAVPTLLTAARQLLGTGGAALFDLYSGYGLFSIGLAGGYSVVRGLEVSQQAVASAMNNARRLRLSHVRFNRSDISPDSLIRTLPMLGSEDAVIMDPPRNGAADGVIEAVADRRPGRVLHVFCNTERLKPDLAAWERSGYTLSRAVTVDNFPGTDHLEVLLLLTPGPRLREQE